MTAIALVVAVVIPDMCAGLGPSDPMYWIIGCFWPMRTMLAFSSMGLAVLAARMRLRVAR